MNEWFFGNILFLYSSWFFLDIFKSWLIPCLYTTLKNSNCVNRPLFKSYWSKVELIQVSHTHIILFLFLIGFICFGMYFISEVSPKKTLQSSFLAPWNPTWETGKRRSLYRSLNNIWRRLFCFFKIFPYNLSQV